MQSQLHRRAKDGEIDKRWKNVWRLVLAEEQHPGSVSSEGDFVTPPFVPTDRGVEMTHAYEVFNKRLVDSEPKGVSIW